MYLSKYQAFLLAQFFTNALQQECGTLEQFFCFGPKEIPDEIISPQPLHHVIMIT